MGHGSRGRVFKARYVGAGHPGLTQGQIVALKVFHTPAGDAKGAEKFRSQAQVLRELTHPNIITFVDAFVWRPGEWDEVKCIATEFLEGETLEDRLRRYPNGMDWPEAAGIFSKVIGALAFAAQRKILHRDIKPSNIFLGADGSVKVFDFDIARKDETGDASTAAWKGTFDYMAPDFLTVPNFRGDEQSDVFSLGICLYEALVGKLPYEPLTKGAHIAYLNRWRGAQKPPDPSFRAGVFRVLANARRVVERAMAPAREHRYATFAQMADDFARIHYRRIRHGEADEYELQALLGRGGFGEVFYAVRLRDNARVAIKHLFAQKQSDRFIREARLVQRCDHKYLVKYIDFFVIKTATQEEQYYLVLEYLDGMPGSSLRYRIKKEGRLEVEEALPLFINYLKALGFLHEGKKPIIHRDIKPTNLYAPKGEPDRAKIFDLGVARDVTGTVTTGGVPGTLDYMAPEFARPGGDRGSPASDIYAIGLCLYEALAGQPAFEKLPMEVNAAWVEFQKRTNGAMDVHFDAPVFKEYPRLAAVIRKSLAKRPEDRFQSCAQMIKALEQSLSAAPGAPEEGATMATVATRTSIEDLPQFDALTGAGAESEAAHAPSKPPPERHEAPTPASSRVSPIDEAALEAVEEPDEHHAATGATRMDGPALDGAAWARKHKARRRMLVIAGGAAALVVVLTGVTALISSWSAGRAGGNIQEIATNLGEPKPSADYVASLQGGLDELKVYGEKYPKMQGEVKAAEQKLLAAARNVPSLFKQAFADATLAKDASAVQSLLDQWEAVRAEAGFMGVSDEEYEERLSYMRRMALRLGFDAELASIEEAIPETISDEASLARAEEAAARYAALAAQEGQGVGSDDRRKLLDGVAGKLARRATDYVERLRVNATRNITAGVDPELELSQVKSVAVQAPALIGLVRPAYDAMVSDLEHARGAVAQEQEMAKLLADIQSATTPAALGAVLKNVAAWEGNKARPPSAESVKQVVAAVKAWYKAYGDVYYKKARAEYEALRIAQGQAHQKNLQALIATASERYGKNDLLELDAGLNLLKKDADDRLARAQAQQKEEAEAQKQKEAQAKAAEAERQRQVQIAEAERRLGEIQKKAASGDTKQLKAGVKYLVEFNAEALKVPSVKKAWSAAAEEYARAIDGAIQQKEPVPDRGIRIEDLRQIASMKGAEAVLGAEADAVRGRIDAQRAKFILRVVNAGDQAVAVSSGDLIRKTVIGPMQRIDFTLAAEKDQPGLPLLVEGQGRKPASKVFGVVMGGGQEVKIGPLEKADAGAQVEEAAATTGKGTFQISVSPKDARIYLDDEEVQAGDITVSSDENHKIRIEAPGYKTYEQYYRVGAGKTKSIDILLVREQKKKGFF
jgi:serine/threonine protein kinase